MIMMMMVTGQATLTSSTKIKHRTINKKSGTYLQQDNKFHWLNPNGLKQAY